VRDDAGRLLAVLGVHATWDWAQSVVDTLKSPLARERGVEIFLFDREGRVILRPPGAAGGERPLALAALPRRGGDVLRWDDGARYLTAAWRLQALAPAADLGWTVVARQPLEMAMSAARSARETALAFGVVGAVFAAMLAWGLAGRISAPLARIARAANAVQAGNLATEIPLERGSRELEGLCDALRGMTGALVQRELELERRVAERTQALSLASEALQRANAGLEQLAMRDGLTGLLNRRAGSERLQQELARHRRSGRPLALALADIDHFKSVNDRHGHAAGDEVLRDVARCLQDACRATDVVVRWGGEEFLVLMPETAADGAAIAGDKLRAAVAAHAGAVPVTLSLGLAVPAQAWRTPEAALDAADQALYAAKAGGRNRVEVAGLPQPAAAPA
jgi:diguanylate cyclase